MHLGEIKFKKKSGKDDQAQPDGTEAGANVAKLLGKNSMLSFLRHFYQLSVIKNWKLPWKNVFVNIVHF
jgi:hypothetical protein